MCNTYLTLLVTLLLFTSQGYGSILKDPSASADDAETLLDDLRGVIFTAFNSSFVAHTILSKQVDEAALNTKSATLNKIQEKGDHIVSKVFANNEGISGLCSDVSEKKIDMLIKTVSDAVTDCVNEQANNSLNYIYTAGLGLASSFLEIVRSLETQIIFCGKSDESCLDGVIAGINESIDLVPTTVDEVITTDTTEVENQIAAIILDCGKQGVLKFNNMILESIQNCIKT